MRKELARKLEDEMTLTQTHQRNETKLQETEVRHVRELAKSNEKIQGLQKTVKQLRAHIKGDARRVEREVQKVIKRVTQGAGVSGVHRVNVKTPQGVVEDWVRDLICELVGEHGIPASRVDDVVSSVSEAFGVKLDGKWSTRTSGRAVDEGGIAAEEMIIHAIRSCMGMLSDLCGSEN